MKGRTIRIGISSERRQLAEAREAWRRAEKGLPPVEPVERLYFPDTATMFRALSATRLDLLSVLRRHGTMNVLALSRKLRRDYKNVYEDVKILRRFGLIQKSGAGIKVPFDAIQMDAEIRLAA